MGKIYLQESKKRRFPFCCLHQPHNSLIKISEKVLRKK
jgi:hypothetical protein